jgi:hypothetical protein
MQGNRMYAFDLQVDAPFPLQDEIEKAISRLVEPYGGRLEMLQGNVQTLALRISFEDEASQKQAEKAVQFVLGRLAESELMNVAES